METLVANLAGKTRRERWLGRDYLVAPLTLIVPGVLPGSKGPLYYPPDEVAREPDSWNHVPIVVYHPTSNGTPTTARRPDVLEKQGVGYVFNAGYRGKLRAEGWFDIERTKLVDPRVLTALEAGNPFELSTGLYTDNEPAPGGSVFNSASGPRPYTYIARNYRPDHLAVLPDRKGACSVADGCGVLVNEAGAYVLDLDLDLGPVLTSEPTANAALAGGKWITLHGSPVYVKDGKVIGGAAHLRGVYVKEKTSPTSKTGTKSATVGKASPSVVKTGPKPEPKKAPISPTPAHPVAVVPTGWAKFLHRVKTGLKAGLVAFSRGQTYKAKIPSHQATKAIEKATAKPEGKPVVKPVEKGTVGTVEKPAVGAIEKTVAKSEESPAVKAQNQADRAVIDFYGKHARELLAGAHRLDEGAIKTYTEHLDKHLTREQVVGLARHIDARHEKVKHDPVAEDASKGYAIEAIKHTLERYGRGGALFNEEGVASLYFPGLDLLTANKFNPDQPRDSKGRWMPASMTKGTGRTPSAAGQSAMVHAALGKKADVSSHVEAINTLRSRGTDVTKEEIAAHVNRLGRHLNKDQVHDVARATGVEVARTKKDTLAAIHQHLDGARQQSTKGQAAAEGAARVAAVARERYYQEPVTTIHDLRTRLESLKDDVQFGRLTATQGKEIHERLKAIGAHLASAPGEQAGKGATSADFATRVVEVAKGLPNTFGQARDPGTEKWMAHKVYVSDLYDHLKPTLGGMGLKDFKQKLLEAHLGGKLTLLRDDIAGTQSLAAGAKHGASEIQHLNATFHTVDAHGKSPTATPLEQHAGKDQGTKTGGPANHQGRVEQEFNHLLPAARGGLVSIPELRQRLGLNPTDFEHAVMALDRSDRLRLVATGDRSRHTKEELAAGIKGENETFMYLEPGPHHAGAGTLTPTPPEPHQALAAAVAGKQGFTGPFQRGPHTVVRHDDSGHTIEAEAGNHSGRFAVKDPSNVVHSRHDTAEAAVAAIQGVNRIGTSQGMVDKELRDRAAQTGQAILKHEVVKVAPIDSWSGARWKVGDKEFLSAKDAKAHVTSLKRTADDARGIAQKSRDLASRIGRDQQKRGDPLWDGRARDAVTHAERLESLAKATAEAKTTQDVQRIRDAVDGPLRHMVSKGSPADQEQINLVAKLTRRGGTHHP